MTPAEKLTALEASDCSESEVVKAEVVRAKRVRIGSVLLFEQGGDLWIKKGAAPAVKLA